MFSPCNSALPNGNELAQIMTCKDFFIPSTEPPPFSLYIRHADAGKSVAKSVFFLLITDTAIQLFHPHHPRKLTHHNHRNYYRNDCERRKRAYPPLAHGALLFFLGLLFGVCLFAVKDGLLYLGGKLLLGGVNFARVVDVCNGVDGAGFAVAFGVALRHGEHTHEYLHLPVARLPGLNVP